MVVSGFFVLVIDSQRLMIILCVFDYFLKLFKLFPGTFLVSGH